MALRGLWLLMASVLFLTQAEAAEAEPDCDPSLRDGVRRSSLRNYAYAYAQRHGRCEGIYAESLSGAGVIQIISLTRNFANLGTGPEVVVWWAAPPAESGKVSLRADSLSHERPYRMDARGLSAPSFVWPIDVLKGESITKDELGVTATFVYNGVRVFLPVNVSQKVTAGIVASSQSGALSLELLVVVHQSVKRLVLKSMTRAAAPGGLETEIAIGKPSGLLPQEGIAKRVVIPPIPIPVGPKGEFIRMRLVSVLPSGIEAPDDFWLYVAPSSQ